MHDLLQKYHELPDAFQHGFDVGIPSILATFTPPNHKSIDDFSEHWQAIVEDEFAKGRYLGPFSQAEVEARIGPFQSSPLSIIPKPGRPGKYRLVQNLSYPASSNANPASVNSAIDSSRYACTWGTFAVISFLMHHLPPGSQAAIRDVKEAYRTLPVKPAHWPGMVVRVGNNDRFAIDTRVCFGLASSAGTYGRVADAAAEIFRARGIGPISKWVDDHIFFRIRREHLVEYNRKRRGWCADIQNSGGQHHEGGRIWFQGPPMPDGRPSEFDEDMHAQMQDLSTASPRGVQDSEYTYCLADVDAVAEELGIPWERSKDIDFTTVFPYIGFSWDLEANRVSIPAAKKEKYLAAIKEWTSVPKHTLADAQKLYGKLLHACLVVPAGRAYLTSLESFMCACHDKPHMLRTPPIDTPDDLNWWKCRLSQSDVSRPTPAPIPITDLDAYSDASSETGIGITIGKQWRAWRLLPGWKDRGRDIGWAESIGFLLLVLYLSRRAKPHSHLQVFGDNQGIVEGWWKGRSRNKPTNAIFKSIHKITQEKTISVYTKYVPSEFNPADGPSRGKYYHSSLLLPPITIPETIQSWIVDFDAPLSPTKLSLIREGKLRLPQPKVSWAGRTVPLSEEEENHAHAEAQASPPPF